MSSPEVALIPPSTRSEHRAKRADAALTAIAEAIAEAGEVDIAYAKTERVDPLLRAGVRRRIRDAYLEAILKTKVRGDGGRHVMQVAYLFAAGAVRDGMPLDDIAWVESMCSAVRTGQAPPSRVWWATVVAALLVAIVGATVATVIMLTRPKAPRELSARSLEGPLAPPSGVFATGGAPMAGDPVITRAFVEGVPQYLIALDRRSRAQKSGTSADAMHKFDAAVDDALAHVLSPEVKEALGPVPAQSFERLLTQAKVAADAATSEHDSADAFMKVAGAFDDDLAAANLGYFVDGDVMTDTSADRRMVILYAFRVEAVSLFDAVLDGQHTTVRALHVRRLDKLNWRHSLLGFTRPNIRMAVVLLDQLDEQLVTYVLPGLGDHAPIDLFAEDSDEAIGAVQARAGELVRAEYGALPGLDAAAARELGDLLRRRQALVNAWQKRASDQGMVLRAPSKLRLDPEYTRGLKGFVSKTEVDEMTKIDVLLGDPRFEPAYDRLRAALVASIERHEVQHRLDFSRATPLPMPAELEALVGPLSTDGAPRPRAGRARDELSAYLAELARDEATPRVNLTMIARFLFDRNQQGVMESYAALVIFDGLAKELDLPEKGPFLKNRSIDHDAAARAYLAMTGRDSGEVRGAARRLWGRLFGGELSELGSFSR